MPVSVIMNQINVNLVQGNGAVSTGQNNLSDWTCQGKANIANGIQAGIFLSTAPINFQMDSDLLDTAITQPELFAPNTSMQI
ncbi:hypothetical protein SAMN04487866_10831 [Thermoactinomyces sp. DSM 45891]|uniref:Uncharacterized protein n=1 Tax=Croceifilum oryzae TaxID=1553429 RepID=A0AAJ1TJK3_9BACL|nr:MULTISPECIES: hypothetical protein [Thermoactinomycetaceae]MDQ0417692.1 hypothetical protein [Croceifilum oryzae]SFX44650.1 hypothetical protein SAMN04487866_10831 [Thermoactinomyces sp. DSM 45891]